MRDKISRIIYNLIKIFIYISFIFIPIYIYSNGIKEDYEFGNIIAIITWQVNVGNELAIIVFITLTVFIINIILLLIDSILNIIKKRSHLIPLICSSSTAFMCLFMSIIALVKLSSKEIYAVVYPIGYLHFSLALILFIIDFFKFKKKKEIKIIESEEIVSKEVEIFNTKSSTIEVEEPKTKKFSIYGVIISVVGFLMMMVINICLIIYLISYISILPEVPLNMISTLLVYYAQYSPLFYYFLIALIVIVIINLLFLFIPKIYKNQKLSKFILMLNLIVIIYGAYFYGGDINYGIFFLIGTIIIPILVSYFKKRSNVTISVLKNKSVIDYIIIILLFILSLREVIYLVNYVSEFNFYKAYGGNNEYIINLKSYYGFKIIITSIYLMVSIGFMVTLLNKKNKFLSLEHYFILVMPILFGSFFGGIEYKFMIKETSEMLTISEFRHIIIMSSFDSLAAVKEIDNYYALCVSPNLYLFVSLLFALVLAILHNFNRKYKKR